MKLLVGYKGTNVGKDLLDLAAKYHKAFGGEVALATSMIGGEKSTQEKIIEAEANLVEASAYLNAQGVRHNTHLLIRGKSPGEDLVDYATENSCDAIMIGVKSRSKVGKILFGSTAQYVILKALCPVISVK
jgi:nucleotide-binding universal stress UspA family protein